jgi:putative ABC transport system permease protein
MTEPRPPQAAQALLLRGLPPDQAAEIVGDLGEVYCSRFPGDGVRGRLWFWWQTVAFLFRFIPERILERLGRVGSRYWRPMKASRPRRASAMEQFAEDIRYAIRSLLRERGFSTLVVVTLAIGVGATTAVFSVVNGFLLRPLPVRDADRVMMVWENDRVSGTEREFASVPDYFDFLEQNTVFEDMAMFQQSSLNFTAEGMDPQRLMAAFVSHSWDDLLGIRLVAGRGIGREEDQPGGRRVAMISEGLWQRLGGGPEVVGQTIDLNDESYTAIAVVAREVTLPSADTDVWLPLQVGPTSTPRAVHNVGQLARLKDGVTVAQAQEEMTSLAAHLEEAYPENAARGAFVEPITEVLRGDIRPALLVLFGAVLAVLLIACANVANLLLARGSRRATELAVHAALGATPRRMLQRFLVESALLTAAAWTGGVVLALLGLKGILSLVPAQLATLGTVTPDIGVLAFTLFVSGVIAFGFGLLPAWQGRHIDLQANLKEGRRQGESASIERMRFQRVLVVAQVGMAFILLVGSALLINSFWRLERVDPGFVTDNIVRMSFRLPESRYPRDFSTYPNWPRTHDFNHRLLEAVEASPTVVSAALAVNHPLDGGFTNSFRIVGREDEAAAQPEMRMRLVSSRYFQTVGVPLLEGRMFDERDLADAPLVMLLNQAAVDRFFPEGDALGARIAFWGMQREVVGVVGNERFQGLAEDAPPAMYAAISQAPPVGGSVLMLRTAAEPMTAVPLARSAIAELDADLAVYDVSTMEATLAESLAADRFIMVLLTAFGAVAVFLAVIGVYGTLAYLVARRRHELGVRLAIGASQRQVLVLVLRQGMRLTLLGLGLGLVGALALSGSLQSLLFEISPLDPVTWVSAVVVLAAAAILAGLVPARRASQVDPLETMRAD